MEVPFAITDCVSGISTLLLGNEEDSGIANGLAGIFIEHLPGNGTGLYFFGLRLCRRWVVDSFLGPSLTGEPDNQNEKVTSHASALHFTALPCALTERSRGLFQILEYSSAKARMLNFWTWGCIGSAVGRLGSRMFRLSSWLPPVLTSFQQRDLDQIKLLQMRAAISAIRC